MADFSYHGSYARFDTANKRDAAVLMNADSIIGDRFTIEIDVAKDDRRAWLVNKFGARVGYFDYKTSYDLSICSAKGWKTVGILSFVAFSEQPEPGIYWGEAALISYDPQHENTIGPFIDRIRALIARGVRPEVDLSSASLNRLAEEPESWIPSGRVDMPAREKGTVILKSRMKFSERLIEQARTKRVGCSVLSWIMLLALIAAAMYGMKACGVF